MCLMVKFHPQIKRKSCQRGEERFREEGETAKKYREEGERKQKKWEMGGLA